MKIYVASSWRNQIQPLIVNGLCKLGHEVYDFRNPEPGDTGFHWSDIDPDWESWTVERYCAGLQHVLARNGYAKDFAAMVWADLCVLVLPCGRSAHLEAGWFVGKDKPVVAFVERIEPELTYRMFTTVCDDWGELLRKIKALDAEVAA